MNTTHIINRSRQVFQNAFGNSAQVAKQGRQIARQVITTRNVAIVLVALMVWGFVSANLHNPATVATSNTKKYQQQLRGQVQSSDGTPNSGRDPASQTQNSLASAASKPSGTGQRTDTIAANVTDNDNATSHHTGSTDDMQGMNMGGSADNGVLASGCLADYGTPGEQCVPSYAPNNQPINCAYVRQQFPQGVKVTGSDSRHLDSNSNGTACDADDN